MERGQLKEASLYLEMEPQPDHEGKVCTMSLSDTPHDRTLDTVSLTMPPESLQSDRKPSAMSQNLPTDLNNLPNGADSEMKPSSVSLNLPLDLNDPQNPADSETVSLNLPTNTPQSETDSDTKPREVSMNLPIDSNNTQSVADSERKPRLMSPNLSKDPNNPRSVSDRETVSLNLPTNSLQSKTDSDTKPREVSMNLPIDSNNTQSVADSDRKPSTVSLTLLTVPSKPLSAGPTDMRPRAVSLNPLTSNSQSAPEMKTRAMSLNSRSVSDSKTKPRTVSFSVPEDHNESRESARDAVLTYQHTEKGVCTATYEDILITRRDGTKVLITDTEARYLPPEVSSGHFCFMKVFAVVAILLFPPLGVAALVTTLIAHRNYSKAQTGGDSKGRSQRLVKIAERLTISAVICGMLMWGVILIVAEKVYQGSGTQLQQRMVELIRGDR